MVQVDVKECLLILWTGLSLVVAVRPQGRTNECYHDSKLLQHHWDRTALSTAVPSQIFGECLAVGGLWLYAWHYRVRSRIHGHGRG